MGKDCSKSFSDARNSSDIEEELINPLQSGVAFLYPLKISENLKVNRHRAVMG